MTLYHKPEYSDKEREMLECFVDSNLLDNVDPVTVYRIAVHEAFIANINGPAVDDLRRTFTALELGTCTRLSPEWDEMIIADRPDRTQKS
jgi:hypothetical protein